MPDPNVIDTAAATGQLLKEGSGWGMAGLLATALGIVAKWWRDETRGRLDDQKEMGKTILADTQATIAQTAAIENREEAFQASVDSQKQAVVQYAAMAATLVEARSEISKLEAELKRTREALLARGIIAP